MKKLLLFMLILMSLVTVSWPIQHAIYARQVSSPAAQMLLTTGNWQTHNFDLVYTVAFSTEQHPNGPLLVYRVSGTDLHANVPVVAVQRDGDQNGPVSPVGTPLFFPSPDGRYLALLSPLDAGYATNLDGASLSIISTAGNVHTLLVPRGVAGADQVIWSPDSNSLYYHGGTVTGGPQSASVSQSRIHRALVTGGYDDIHRVDLAGHDTVLFHHTQDDSSLRLIGLDRSGMLILTLARPHMPVQLLRLNGNGGQPLIPLMTLPPDILPGNVLRVGGDGASVECERVLSWQPLRTMLVRINFTNQGVSAPPLFDVRPFGQALAPLSRSADGNVLVMSQTMSVRGDLTAQGIPDVPAQEALWLADAHTGATQRLLLPYGGQIVQAFWTAHIPTAQLHAISQAALSRLLTPLKTNTTGGQNASVNQQDEWMLEGHANLLANGPILPYMCYGYCPQGLNGTPHTSAAILHGVAYTESDWFQFNAPGHQVGGEPVGSPIESWDGGWGEFQQTWGMPPQCVPLNNCRADASRIQHEQAYNIGVGVQSLINAWNGTAGVASQTDPNDPYKANQWFFAVWAYNGSYGNNPNDIPTSQYAHWYPGAPFRSIYQEYVWYFAAHNQHFINGWTDNYLPSLGTALLPPQSDFINTSDSFVYCVTCTIPDWTPGTYDRDWVALGAPNNTVAGYFKAIYNQSGGEDVVGLPRDNGGGASIHRWGSGWVQDFGGGSFKPGILMLADGTSTVYWVFGGVWTRYLTADHGVQGCHGYPTSPLAASTGPGTDTYYRQNFQRGFIVWDATTVSVASDACNHVS